MNTGSHGSWDNSIIAEPGTDPEGMNLQLPGKTLISYKKVMQ